MSSFLPKPKVVILAAGLGSRLGELTAEKPKCLIEVGGKPLIEYTLRSLKLAGIDQVLIVTGYLESTLKNALLKYQEEFEITFKHNADFATTGSALSLFLAKEYVQESSCLILESDLLYHPAFIQKALEESERSKILAADLSGSGDEVYVGVNEKNNLSFLGKNISKEMRSKSVGEFAGITLLAPDFFKTYCKRAEVLKSQGKATGHYEELIFEITQTENLKVEVVKCSGLAWTEVDNASDLKRAEQSVYPKIQNAFKKTDVAFVISDLGSGGAQRVLSQMANHWANSGLNVAVLTFPSKANDFYKLHPAIRRVTVETPEVGASLYAKLRYNVSKIMNLRKSIRSLSPRVVMSLIFETNITTLVACSGLSYPLVISERNDPKTQSKGFVWDMLRRTCYKFAGKVTANSHHALKTLASYVPEEKLVFLPNPITLPANISKDTESNIVLAVGRLHPQKGYDTLLKAFQLFARTAPNWRLEIAGEGALSEELKSLAETLGISSQVSFLGAVENISTCYERASIFVLSSRYEGLPNALLEAMSYALPVIATECSSVSTDLIHDAKNGFLVKIDSPEVIAEKLNALSKDRSLRQKLGNEARASIQKFEMEEVSTVWKTTLGLGQPALC